MSRFRIDECVPFINTHTYFRTHNGGKQISKTDRYISPKSVPVKRRLGHAFGARKGVEREKGGYMNNAAIMLNSRSEYP